MMWIEELVIHGPNSSCSADSIDLHIREELSLVCHVMEEDLMCDFNSVMSSVPMKVGENAGLCPNQLGVCPPLSQPSMHSRWWWHQP